MDGIMNASASSRRISNSSKTRGIFEKNVHGQIMQKCLAFTHLLARDQALP